jgi:hypothetical protein
MNSSASEEGGSRNKLKNLNDLGTWKNITKSLKVGDENVSISGSRRLSGLRDGDS